jgi:hypothetical protein
MDEQASGDEGQVEEKSDREDGGPTADQDADGEATGGATGTRDSQFDSHE